MRQTSPLLRPGLRAAALAAAMVALTPAMDAATVVKWGGDYVTNYQEFTVAPPSTGPGWWTYNYSTTHAINPVGPRFYGAFSIVNNSGAGALPLTPNRFGIINSGSGGAVDSIRVGVTADADTGQVSMRGLIFFQKEDFIDVSPGQKVNFSDGGSLSLTVSSLLGDNNQRRVRLAVYALVGSEWGWYLSDTGVTTSSSLDIADAASELWAPYELDANSSPLDPQPSVYDVSGSLFEEIGAFGFHFVNRATKPATSDSFNATLFVTDFTVNASVIPEPGVALLSVTGLLFLTGRRFLKTQSAK